MKQSMRTAKTHTRSEQGKMKNVPVRLLLITYNFEPLQRRAGRQVERIEDKRISAIREAFAGAIRSK